MSLLQKYGHCHLPKGTLLFRKGSINPEIGAFFALHPNWAFTSAIGGLDTVDIWEIKQSVDVLFMFKFLNQNGQPITAIEEIYRDTVGDISGLDDLDIKWRNRNARIRFMNVLKKGNVSGWLSTIENYDPLEVFLLPNITSNLSYITRIYEDEYKGENMLRLLDVFPSERFMQSSLINIKPRLELINDRQRESEAWYSLYEKIFLSNG